MKELTVFYCPKCGRYGYYQLVRNAVCANCDVKMVHLSTPYTEFTHMSREERDQLICDDILKTNGSISNRILAADRAHNGRNQIATLQSRINELESENKRLNETVDWMHQTIWDLLSKSKALERQLAEYK